MTTDTTIPEPGHPGDAVGRPNGTFGEVLAAFTRLGLTSFGGPVAHLGYFRDEFVGRRRWLDEAAYADLVALCQFLPGPASSQVGFAIGLLRAGLTGGFAAWLGFTVPSAVAMALFASGVEAFGGAAGGGALHGLKIVAVAVVAQAVWSMARSLAPDRPRATIASVAAVCALALPTGLGQLAIIAASGLAGWRLLPPAGGAPPSPLHSPVGRRWAVAALASFFALLALLPLVRGSTGIPSVALVDSFYRSGALVFGGGHVVLPLLQAEVVASGWVTPEQFVAGYGAAQAVPGPLFTFSAYLGALATAGPGGAAGAALCLVAIYAPSLLLVLGSIPFWNALRARSGFGTALRGVNAGVVGLLAAALYQPVWTSAIFAATDLMLAILAFALLQFWKTPPWLVVVATAVAGFALGTR